MLELFLSKNKRTIFAFTIALFFGMFAVTFAQEPTVTETKQQLDTIEQRFRDSMNQAAALGQNTATKESREFFQVSNIALWTFWAISIGVLLLLIAIRRNIKEIIAHEPHSERVYVVEKNRNKMSKGFKKNTDTSEESEKLVSKDKSSQPQRKLVKPVKVVKIKVRKIKKSKTSK